MTRFSPRRRHVARRDCSDAPAYLEFLMVCLLVAGMVALAWLAKHHRI